ncbi:putative UPF0496 protein 2 [Wolffia australiana]
MGTAINLSDEYREVLRTQSYAQVYAQIHGHLRSCNTHTPFSSPRSRHEDDSVRRAQNASLAPSPASSTSSPPSSPFFCYSSLPEHLLAPHDQDALSAAVPQPDLHNLFADYFNASVEACNVCASLLWSIEQLRRERTSLQRMLNPFPETRDLSFLVQLRNPLVPLKTVHLQRMLDLYQSLIDRLIEARNGVLRRKRILGVVKRASGFVLVVACGALAAAVVVLATHAAAIVAMAGVPALFFWARRRRRPWRPRQLARLAAQLDLAARGAYIMNRDMETISRMVTRLHDEVEHEKGVLRLFLRSRESSVLEEAAESGGAACGGIAGQLDELEEHVYWCLLTIKRTRELVVREVMSPGSQEFN